MAHTASQKSPDLETKVGCVIVDEDHNDLVTGFNGFPAKTNDDNLPRKRPEKYPFMIHAEQNAVCFMKGKGKNLTAYITAKPCLVCVKLLWQVGVRRIVVDKNGVIHSETEQDRLVIDFLSENGLEFFYLDRVSNVN